MTDLSELLERDGVPNPGSPKAVERGCACPVIDNHHGRGVPFGKDGTPLFWHSEKCPIHGQALGEKQ